MFNNLINRHDVGRVIGKIRRDGWDRISSIVKPSAQARVESAWRHADSPPRHWGRIPQVRRRWNELISGDPDVDLRRHTIDRHLTGRSGLVGLSLACGSGGNELRWAATGAFASIEGLDISSPRITSARKAAVAAGLDDVLIFKVADARSYNFGVQSYDVIIAESALHHMSGLPDLIARLRWALKPDGLLVLNDFVGPSRFQWTDAQLRIVNQLLRDLPPRYRKRWKTRSIKRSFHRPGRLLMRLADPSEAAESDAILDVLGSTFELVELKPYGGTILQLIFDDIAHNFLDGSIETDALIRHCFEVEDAALASCDIGSDFVYAIYRAE